MNDVLRGRSVTSFLTKQSALCVSRKSSTTPRGEFCRWLYSDLLPTDSPGNRITPAAKHAEKPRIKKHWDLRKISARYKSRPPRYLLFLVPVSHSLFATTIDKRRDSSRESHRTTSFLRQSKERDLMIAKRIADRGWWAPLIVGHQRGSPSFFPRRDRYVNIHGNFMPRKVGTSRQLKTWFDCP